MLHHEVQGEFLHHLGTFPKKSSETKSDKKMVEKDGFFRTDGNVRNKMLDKLMDFMDMML